MASIKYTRGTTYTITHKYTGPNLGATLLFTAKVVSDDADTGDLTTVLGGNVIVKKTVAMSGSTFPQSTLVTINPADVPDSVSPGTYFCDLKVIDNTGAIFEVFNGSFILLAGPTNRLS